MATLSGQSPPSSPPLAKRARLDPDESFATFPPTSSSTSQIPSVNGNGHANGRPSSSSASTSAAPPQPPATSAPAIPELNHEPAPDYQSSDDEEDVELEAARVKEEEDITRKDMYLDTVSAFSQYKVQVNG